jgi:hypothetical protein
MVIEMAKSWSRTYNPHWERDIITEGKKRFKRNIFKEVRDQVDKEDWIILYGPLGIGKTTILAQVIDDLLDNNVDPKRILYLSLEDDLKLAEELEFYEKNVLRESLKDTKKETYIFLDEVQYNSEWYYITDSIKGGNEKVHVIATASYVLDDLPSNIKKIFVKPLTFREYLAIKKIYPKTVKFEVLDLRRKYVEYLHLSEEFDSYLLTGGIPSLMDVDDINEISKRARNEIINKIIYMLIPRAEKRKEPYLVEKILKYISYSVGSQTNYNHLSSMLGKDIRTIINYFDIAIKSFLLYQLKNKIERGRSSRKLPKTYPYSPAYAYAFYPEKFSADEYIGKVIEGFIALHLDARFYWKKANKEISIIWERDGVEIPIVVNYTKRLSRREIKKIDTALKKVEKDMGIIIAKDTFEIVKKERELWIMPPWLLLLTLS